MKQGKTCVTQKQNNGLSEKFKNQTVQIFNRTQKNNSSITQNGTRKNNSFPWGRKNFLATKKPLNKQIQLDPALPQQNHR